MRNGIIRKKMQKTVLKQGVQIKLVIGYEFSPGAASRSTPVQLSDA